MFRQIPQRAAKLRTLPFCRSLLFVCLVSLKVAAQQPALVISQVTVIDMVDPKPQRDMTVIVHDNRISSITKSGKVHIPKNAQVIDGRGEFLMPGLWDMHVHALRKERVDLFFPLFIANGITGIRDMGTTADGFA